MIKFTTSNEANPNYLCKLVALKGLKKHNNADRLQVVTIDFQNVITGLDASDGDIYVYFPVESKINSELLSFTNSFREKTKNRDIEKAGFFEDNCRVRAMKLRGERSQGYIIPITEVLDFLGIPEAPVDDFIDTYFDTIEGVKVIEKFIPKMKVSLSPNKQGKKAKESRVLENQFHFHVDTENLRKNVDKIISADQISVSYKLHGTSVILSNVLVKKPLNWFQKLVSKILPIEKYEYDLLYSSRKVIKNGDLKKEHNHFYGEDVWGNIAMEYGPNVPKGFTVYGEIVGYLSNGSPIQKLKNDYDYGCPVGTNELYVYRVTFTNIDGIVTELSTHQVEEFCNKYNFKCVPIFYIGPASTLFKDYLELVDTALTPENVISGLEYLYNERDCYMCTNKVPEEGVVVRVEKFDSFEAYKLKSFRFLEGESAQDNADIETEN